MAATPNTTGLRFAPYDQTLSTSNIVVDGSPNEATVLTLTHWPGIAQPLGGGGASLAADTSAEMVFNYLDHPPPHEHAELVTNNHFDQDGLVGVHGLVYPDLSLEYRDKLIDVATAGDFATYQFRSSARASMALWSLGQQERAPSGASLDLSYPEMAALLYEESLPMLVPMLREPDNFRDLWHDEDQQLDASEAALADGRVTLDVDDDLDLALVTINDESLGGGHRFATEWVDLIHPMAVHNATTCSRILLIRGAEYRYIDRYETWVQYQTRQMPKRVDLASLATQLTALETGAVTWSASPPSALTPLLRPDGESSLATDVVTQSLRGHLRSAPPAWDPFANR